MIENGLCVPKTSEGHGFSRFAAKKCRSPKTWPNSWIIVSICSSWDCSNIVG